MYVPTGWLKNIFLQHLTLPNRRCPQEQMTLLYNKVYFTHSTMNMCHTQMKVLKFWPMAFSLVFVL